MSKQNIWMKKYTEVLKDGDWHPFPTEAFQEQRITAGKFEEITSKRASDFFETGNAKTVEMVCTRHSKSERTIYHFYYID